MAHKDGQMLCGFEQIISVIPSNLEQVDQLVKLSTLNADALQKLVSGGLRKIPVDSEDQPLSVLVHQAIACLAEKIPDLAGRTEMIMLAHSVPILAPSDVSFFDLCVDELGFENVPRIALSGQPCAILHMGVKLASGLLSDISSEHGVLLLGADKVYSPKDRLFFGSAMGDSVIAAFVTHETKRHQVLAVLSHSQIIAYDGEKSPAEDIAKFRALNPSMIRFAIEKCLAEGEVALDDLALIVPHTPYTMIWDVIAELLRFPRDRILTDYISETGHLNSNDSFAHYIRAVDEGRIREGDLALLINPGFGGTRGCTLIRS